VIAPEVREMIAGKMRSLRVRTLAAAAALTVIVAPAWGAGKVMSVQNYARADAVRALNPLSLGGRVFPHWLRDGTRFYYASEATHDHPGTTFLVDPRSAVRRPLFDAARVAGSLGSLTGSPVSARHLPKWSLVADDSALWFDLPAGKFLCELSTSKCQAASAPQRDGILANAVPKWAVRSPDGRWDAFIWNHNVYIRPANPDQVTRGDYRLGDYQPAAGNARFGGALERTVGDFYPSGQRADCDHPAPAGPIPGKDISPPYEPPPAGSIALTRDGTALWSYGPRFKMGMEVATLDSDRYRPTKGVMAWAPDSSKLVVRREDIRDLRIYPLYSSTSNQPVDHSYYYAVPGDSHVPQGTYYVIDIARRSAARINVPPTDIVEYPTGAQWSKDSRRLFVLTASRGEKSLTLSVYDAGANSVRTVLKEASPSFVETSNGGEGDSSPQIAGSDVIWFSERDGWGHLYRYAVDGRLENQIDAGHYSVADIVHVDEAARQVYFTAWGKAPGNPYYRHLYRIDFDGTHVASLTPQPGDHLIQWFPDGKYFLDTHSSVDKPPVTVVRRADGKWVMPVARGEDEDLRKIGWRPAMEFTVKARDGATDLYGIMYLPYDFDPARRYPIIANVYPGPFAGSADWTFNGPDNYASAVDTHPVYGVTHDEGMSQSLADFGFVVIRFWALGTAHRSKAMQDYFYGHVLDNGLPDLVAAIKQLSGRYPWIDASRAGIVGHSGGGYTATAGMFLYPDFFKVGVEESGNNDFRVYGWYWGEKYQGLLDSPAAAKAYEEQASYRHAAALQGKLLLIHGDMDCNNPTAETLRVVDALIKDNKPFDMLIVPDAGHQMPGYVMERVWNYFIGNLLGETPRTDYRLRKVGPWASSRLPGTESDESE
jgi:dipeptidyl aminopeptidase/acylaminoacyl peptidase